MTNDHENPQKRIPHRRIPQPGAHQRRGGRFTAHVLIAVLVSGIVLGAGVGTASADSSCGEFSFGFAGTRLLNDGISDSAGPFAISLPAGNYDVTMVSADDHVGHPDQVDQTAEQFVVVLDSGYVSPPSRDIADSESHATTVHSAQTIEDAFSISVRHLGVGNVNSVDVVCVGFTPVAEPVEAGAVPVDVQGAIEQADPDIVDPLGLVRVRVEPQARAELEVGPVLALTGPSDIARLLGLVGLGLVAMGAMLVRVDRRRHALAIERS